MSYVTKIDLVRQVKSRSGSTATLSGSTIIKEDLTVIRSFSGGTVSASTIYSASTNLYNIFSTKSDATGNYVDVSGDTMTGALFGTSFIGVNITGSTISASTISADTINGMGANDPYYYKTSMGALESGINGVYISGGNLKGTTLSATTFMDFEPQSSLPNAAPGRVFFSGGTLSAMMYCSGLTASDWVVMNKTGFI